MAFLQNLCDSTSHPVFRILLSILPDVNIAVVWIVSIIIIIIICSH